MEERTPFQPPLLVTYDEAAQLLSVSARTVQRMIGRGDLAVVRLTVDTPRLRYADLVKIIRGDGEVRLE